MVSARFDLPGVTPAGGPEPTLEWVRAGGGIRGALCTRLGSDPRADELLLAVVKWLRGSLELDTWEGILDELPFSLRAMLRSAAEPGSPADGDLVHAVARSLQHPPVRAAFEVRAVFAALKQELPRGLADSVPEELPPELAEMWRAAR